MTYAVISSGSKQYQVKPGQLIEVEILEGDKIVTFDQVLLYVEGDKIEVGNPTVKGVTVTGEVVNPAKKGEKIRVFKFKHKSRYRKLRGHRQVHAVVKILSVGSAKLESPVKKAVKAEVKTTKSEQKSPVTAKRVARSVKKAPVKKAATKK